MSTLFNMAVLLSLNAGGFHAGMSAAGNALTQMAAKAANSQAAVDRLAMSMKALAAGAVITGLGVAMAVGLSDAAKKGADLQKVLTGIQLTTGATKGEMAGLQRGLVGIALKNQMSVTDAANVALAAAHTGITDPKQLAQTVGTVANFAEVQQISNHTSRESATTTAVEYAHIFGAYIPSLLNPLVNTLSKALTHTPLSSKGFENLVSQFAGVTRSVYGTSTPNRLRLQSDDTLMGVLLGQLGQGTRGGTQYSSALSRMATAKPGTAAWAGEQALQRAGHGSFFNKDGTFGGVQNMLQVLTTAAKTIGNPQELARINKSAFGMVGGRLMGLLEDPVTLQRWQQNQATFNRIPNLDKQQAAYNATNAGQSQQLSANVSTLITLFSLGLLPVLVRVTSAFVGITKTAIEFASAHPGVMKIVSGFALVATGAALVIGPLLLIAGAVGVVSVAMGALDAVSLPVVTVVVAIAAAVAGAIYVWQHWGSIVSFFTGVWHGLVQRIAPLAGILAVLFPEVAAVVAVFQNWSRITGALGAVWSGLGTAVKLAWDIISRSPIKTLLSVALSPMLLVVIAIKDAVNLLSSALSHVGDIAAKVAGPLGAVANVAGKALGVAGGAVHAAASAAGSAGSTFLNWAGAGADDPNNPLHHHIHHIQHAVKHAVQHGDTHTVLHQAVTHAAHHVSTHTVNNTVLHHAVTHVAQHTVAHTQVSPAPNGHGGGGTTVHHTETHHHTNHFHISGADARTTEHLAKIVAQHVQAAQGRELGHTSRNRPLVQHGGLVPSY